MTLIESLFEIKLTALELQSYLLSNDPVVSKRAQIKYEQLVDRFFRENKTIVTPQQLNPCLHNFSAFMILMEEAIERYYLDLEK
jgi:hypothetical protein